MATITFRADENDAKLIQSYAAAHNQPVSVFVRNAVLEKIEDDLQLDEERIRKAYEASKTEKRYSHEEVWDMLGV